MNAKPATDLRRWVLTLSTGLLLGTALVLTPGTGHAQGKELPDFTELVERSGPAVVNIRTVERVRASARGLPEMDEQMQEFFRRFGIPVPNQRRGQPRNDEDLPQRRGVGSGFIISADGFVMTNAHVVDGADEVIVTMTDKREFKAKLIGADARTDVAVVKIEGTGLPLVKIGDANRLKVGEWVIAIGSPFNLDNTVTAGIVSAKARDTGELLPFIQTDVAINPGNSGGPLINMRGEVVGINSQIYSQSGGYMGISFAIPIDEAMRVADSLRSNGRVVRGRIGVGIGDVSKEVAEAIGLGKPTGAAVSTVEAGSPADKGGVEGGDIITKVDGKTIEKSGDLRRLISGIKPGTKATLQVFRRGAYKELSVTVAEMEAEQRPRRQADGGDKSAPPAQPSVLGLTVADLTDAQRKELKLKIGVRVESAEGAAARAGLREGDIILAVDNTEIANAKQFSAVVSKLEKAKVVTMQVRRENAVSFVLVKPAK
ncbi:MAG: DegQ family serine endoprotease [Burkholderiaceae bacterium]|nr:DegQ family serine endoprotease [Burkholderiaceae bacterium]